MLLKCSHKCILNNAVAMIYLLFRQVQLWYKRSWSSQNKLEVVMNSHTSKKVSVSCSLIKKKRDSTDNFDFVFGEVPEAKLSLKRTIFLFLWDFRGTGQTEFLEAAFQSLEMSRSKIIFSSCGLSWNLSRGISCPPSAGGCRGGWHHQKSQQGIQHKEIHQFPLTPRQNFGQKNAKSN